MSANNPSITAANIITDVENRLGNPNISTSVYLPWVSYAYQKTYAALANVGQEVKERLFGNYTTYTLTNGTAEYALSTILPRFSSVIKLEILYGGTGDQRVRLSKLRTISGWDNQGNVSTSYRPKTSPLYYLLEDTLGIIPTPPASDSSQGVLYAWYVRRPYQITDGADVIDIDYRFIYPIVNYVQAKALQKENEAYATSGEIERLFLGELEDIAEAAASEYNENEGEFVQDTSTVLHENPLR